MSTGRCSSSAASPEVCQTRCPKAFTLRVFTGDTAVQGAASFKPVSFAETKRVRDRALSVPEFAQLPDHSYALWDWALGNETCPLDSSGPVACHDFKTHMGAVNSNHFPPQSKAFYTYYHQLALDRAAACAEMGRRLQTAGGTFTAFHIACGRQALTLEAIGQHFLQDAWASGHMWERWGSPDLADFPSITEALMVAITSGLIHGARAVLEDPNLLTHVPYGSFVAAQLINFEFDDPLNAPGPEVGFRSPGDAVPQPGLGDLYLDDLLEGQGENFSETYKKLFSCSASGLRAVYRAAGAPEGPLGDLHAGLTEVDPTSDTCFGQRVTNRAMQAGIGIDLSPPHLGQIHVPLDPLAATQLVAHIATEAGGNPTDAQTAQYQVDMAHIMSLVTRQAGQDPNGVGLASGGLPPLLGIQANHAYVKTPLAAYVDPSLPWPAATGSGGDADRRVALARTFHRAHAIDWCNRFQAGSAEQLDVDALRAHVASLSNAQPGDRELTAACTVCTEFAARHLRVGTGASDYAHNREPLCHFIADNPATTQYVYQPGHPDDAISTLAASYCGCGVTVTVLPPTITVTPGQLVQFTARVIGASDTSVTWTASGGGITNEGKFAAGNQAGSFKVRATSNADQNAFDEADVTVATVQPSSQTFSGTLTMTNVSRGFLVQSLSATVTLQVAASGQITVISASGTFTTFSTPPCDPCSESVPISEGFYVLSNVDNGIDDTLQFTHPPGGPGNGLVNVKGHRVFVNDRLVEIDFTRMDDFFQGNVEVITTPYFTVTKLPFAGAVQGALVGEITQTGILLPNP